MTIKFQTITLKNFLSVGAVTQSIDFDRQDLTLVLGENLDLGGQDAGSRNGVGKTAALQALAYALFGVPLNNIKKDNLVNRTNGKTMMVTVDFEVGGVGYRIERGRKPNVLRFYTNGTLNESGDSAQGENRETQAEIERLLGMNIELFRHIVALNTYNQPFLAMRVSDQRAIIEQLLGITLLSEKAELVKNLIRMSKDAITVEEVTIKANEESNKRVTEQITSLKRRQSLWRKKRDEDLTALITEYDELAKIDIAAELQAHKDLKAWTDNGDRWRAFVALLARQTAWRQKLDGEIIGLCCKRDELQAVDIESELAAHKSLALYNTAVAEQAAWTKAVAAANKLRGTLTATVTKLTAEVRELDEHRCYACGQEFHDERHTSVLAEKQRLLAEAQQQYDEAFNEWRTLSDNPITVPAKPTTKYATEAEAIRVSSDLQTVLESIENKRGETDPYIDQINEYSAVDPGPQPKTIYDTEEAAFKHSGRVATLIEQIERKNSEADPYSEQIVEMESAALVTISFDNINALNSQMEHQKFLLDLLTNKDSFVRKRIIDQNLQYLNSRLTYYLDRIGLPHQVVFMNDLSVQITELGRELDFDSMSRGESNRVILSLNFAFRDVWENLYQPINTVFIDELLDSGMDAAGVENGLALLKDFVRNRGKSIWLVSHRDELASRVNSIMKVTKDGGFTSYSLSENG